MFKMWKKLCALILVSVFILNLRPIYPFETLSLDALIKEAKENNPEILAAKKRYDASIARIPQAKSLDNPSIGISFEKIPKGTLKLNENFQQRFCLELNR